MLLLTQILRPRYRGVIHLPPGTGGRPEIEFSGGEGPEQVMDQVQDFAVPEIRKCVEPLGPCLRWQELDLDAGLVRRRRTSFHDRLDFVLCPDERGIELVLAGDETAARPWVPLRPHAEPGPDQRATIGWTVTAPELGWRYLQTRHGEPAIEITWACACLPAEWAARVLARAERLDCRIGGPPAEGSGAGLSCALNPGRDGLLAYRGYRPLPTGDRRPAVRRLALRQPLLVAEPEAASPRHRLDEELPASVTPFDFRARIDGRATRLVAGADLERPFSAEVWTGGEALMPDTIPAGAIPGLPWPLAVTAAEIDEPAGEAPADSGLAASRRRWWLAARPEAGEQGSWGEVVWRGEPPALAFGLGSFDPERATRVTRIAHRRASVGWRIEAEDEGGRLCLGVPRWVPVGCPELVASPGPDANGTSPASGAGRAPALDQGSAGDGFDYAVEARARIGGLEERFVIDQRSELPANRLFLGPRRWRFRDEAHGPLDEGEALGEGAGCVRWRHPGGEPETSPTDWAGGSAPVLLVTAAGDDPLCWGGLYAPRPIPWEALEEVVPEPAAGDEEVLLAPASPGTVDAGACPSRGSGTSGSANRRGAIWIDLWGFVCRYDVRPLTFSRGHGETGEVTAWFADGGLELFPRRGGQLLRSFSPLYAVRDPEPGRFSLQAATPRPILRVGHELVGSRRRAPAEVVLEIGAETFVRYQVATAGDLPRSFEPGRVPGTRARINLRGGRVAWLAVEQRDGTEGRPAGYLLSWDAERGWRFRGYFAHRHTTVELGVVRRGGTRRRVVLGGEEMSRVSAFRLTLDAAGEHWSDGAPEPVRRELTPGMIRSWESDHFAPERRPAPLQPYGLRVVRQAAGGEAWIFELFDGRTPDAGPTAGIRAWELQVEAGAALSAGARALGQDPADRPRREPEKRILRADEDDDF